jgi:hypothetical protein
MTSHLHRSHAVSSLAEYYKGFPWQWFCTFTFPRLPRGDDDARSRWKHFINDVERTHGDNIGRLVAEESRHASGALSEIRLHYHALLTSDHAVPVSLLRDRWKKYAGNGKKLIDVQQYDQSKRGVEYLLKLHGSWDGEIEFANLDLYSAHPPEGWDRNCCSRRRWRRQLARRALAAA